MLPHYGAKSGLAHFCAIKLPKPILITFWKKNAKLFGELTAAFSVPKTCLETQVTRIFAALLGALPLITPET